MAAISIYWLVRSGPLMDACLAEKAELDGEVNDRLNTHGDNAKSGKWSRQLTVLFVCSVVFAVINNLLAQNFKKLSLFGVEGRHEVC